MNTPHGYAMTQADSDSIRVGDLVQINDATWLPIANLMRSERGGRRILIPGHTIFTLPRGVQVTVMRRA